MNKLSYSKKQYLKAKFKFYIVLFTLIAVLVLDIIFGIGRMNFTIQVFVMLFIFACGFMFYPLFQFLNGRLSILEDKILKDWNIAELGIKGEDTVMDWLKQILPGNEYIILPNVVLPNHRFDIDFIVIGPKGIVALEVKNFTGKYHFSSDDFFKINNGQMNILDPLFDPRSEVRRHTFSLREYFELKGHSNIRILKAVVFIDKSLVTIEGNTGIYIATGYDSLKSFFDNMTLDDNYTSEYCQKIKQILNT